MISGIALALAELSPQTKVWTAEPEHHDDWKRSLESGDIVSNPPGTHSICDAILTSQPGPLTWAVASKLLSGGFAVTDDDVKRAMHVAYHHLDGLFLEPGGAAALAVALRGLPCQMQGARVCIVVTGGNVDASLHAACIA